MFDWAKSWKEGRIGFHQGRPNDLLVTHAARLGAARRVLVPLCGKAEDLAFLAAHGHEVIGIELVEEAVQAFFREHDLVPEIHELEQNVTRYSSGAVTILRADVFACTKPILGRIDAFYDRAALVALPPDVRARYIAHLREVIEPEGPGLLITFEYDSERLEPPPWSVPEAEVRRLASKVELLTDQPTQTKRALELGVPVREKCFLITL